MVTNNMDVFDTVTSLRLKLEELFEGTSGLSNGGLPTERKMATVSLEVVYKF